MQGMGVRQNGHMHHAYVYQSDQLYLKTFSEKETFKGDYIHVL